MVSLPNFTEAQLVASISRDSFYDFLREMWDVFVFEDPVWNWHIEFLCNELQEVGERIIGGYPKDYDLIINIPPGTTKSTICSVAWPAWMWTRMPRFKAICGSHTDSLALDLALKSRNLIQSERYTGCFPDIRLAADQNTKHYYANTSGGIRFSVGVGGSVIGMHGHALVVDDPIDPQKAISELELATSNRWITETLSTRKVDKRITPLILIMQRLHQNDPTGHLREKGKTNLRVVSLPAFIDAEVDRLQLVQPTYLRKYYKDGYLDPIRLSEPVLTEAREDLGEYGYAGQFRQYPIPLGGGMFKTGELIYEDREPTLTRFKTIVRYWDTAGTPGGGAFTAGVKIAEEITPGQRLPTYWLLDVVRGQWGSEERERIIANTARLDGMATEVGLEEQGGSSGKEVARWTARNLAGFTVRIDKPTGDKAARAYPFSSQVNVGNVHILRRNWTARYVDEMAYFPNSTYKDQVDATSGGFALLTKPRIEIGAMW